MAEYDDAVTVLTSALGRKQFRIGETRTFEGTPCKAVLELPFYSLVPKDTIEQLRWRIYVRDRMAIDEEFRQTIDYCCSQDILFAFNTLFWIFEPRPTGRKMLFNTWVDQDDYIMHFKECIDQQRDAIGEKCRGVGWSYIGVGLAYYDWRWPPVGTMSMIGMVSRKKEAVDSDDSDSLFWKLDYIHENMPECVRLDENGRDTLERKEFKFINRLNGCQITGYEAGPNAMTGGRKRWILHDEAAKFPYNAQEVLDSTQHVTNCRLVISTFWRGTRTRFYQMARKEESGALRVIGDWKNNPERSAGLYTFENGLLKIINANYDFPPDYQFVNKDVDRDAFGGRIRSPWYDAECTRLGATRRSIAEEIDRDPQNTGGKLFEPETLDVMIASIRDGRPLHRKGLMLFKESEPRVSRFMNSERGDVDVWRDMTEQFELVHGGPYCAGVDLAGGGGSIHSANSALEVIDQNTGEQILEFVSNRMPPDRFAENCFAIFHWIVRKGGQGQLVVNFESNSGLGKVFGERLIMLGWQNFFQEKDTLRGLERRLMKYGSHNADRGESWLIELQRAALCGETIIHSDRVRIECEEYEYDEEFKLIHASSPASQTGTGKAHGDAAIAYALAWKARQDRQPTGIISRQRPIPASSIAGMFLAEQERLRADGLDEWYIEPDNAPQHPLFRAMEDKPFIAESLDFDAFRPH